jgi:hypothetical protein
MTYELMMSLIDAIVASLLSTPSSGCGLKSTVMSVPRTGYEIEIG